MNRKSVLYALVSTGLMGWSATTSSAIEEIVVTAQKKSENLQDVPIAVTALTEDTIEKTRILGLEDVANKTPNFVIGQQSPTQPELTIRGIGSTDREAGSDRSVVVFQDDVYIGRASASTFDLFDLERIEVLRGPQGTLFGRNVSGGAINLISRKPSRERYGKVQVSAGDYGLIEARGLINGALSETTSGKLAASFRSRDGFYDNRLFGDRESNDLESSSLRGQLLFEPDDLTRVFVNLDVSQDEIDGVASKITQGETTDAGFAAALAPFGPFIPDPDEFTVANNKFGDIERDSIALYARVDLERDYGVWTFIPAHRRNQLDERRDIAGIGFTGMGSASRGFESTAINDETYTSSSFELRLASNTEESALDWILGLYYLTEEIERDQIRERQANTAFSRPLFDQDVELTSYAIFGEFAWDITEQLTLTMGGRYTRDDKDFDMSVINTLSAAEQAEKQAELGRATSLNPATAEYSADTSDDWSEFTPKVTLEYEASDSVLLYATWSEGFKSGGFVGLAANQAQAQRSFAPEFVTNTEVGAKTTFLDNTLQLNFSYFTMDFEDLQLRDRILTIPGDVTSAIVTIANAGEAEIDGFEFEAVIAPSDWFTAFVGYGNLDSEVTRVNPGSNIVLGSEIPRAADSTLNVATEFNFPIRQGELELRLDYRQTGDFFFDLNEQAAGEEKSYGLLDARLGYSPESGRWDIALWGKNITDEEYRSHVQSIRAGRAGIAQIGNPATWGLTLTYEFE